MSMDQIDRAALVALRWALILGAVALGAVGPRACAIMVFAGLMIGGAIGARREMRRAKRWWS